MPDKNEVLCFLGGVVGGVVLTKLIHPLAEDDRPVIVVSGGSIKFSHDKKWKKHDNSLRAWQLDADRPSLTKFIVQITDPALSGAHDAFNEVEIDFVSDVGVLLATFKIARHEQTSPNKIVPVLRSPEDLELSISKKSLKYDKDGHIGSVRADTVEVATAPQELRVWIF